MIEAEGDVFLSPISVIRSLYERKEGAEFDVRPFFASVASDPLKVNTV